MCRATTTYHLANRTYSHPRRRDERASQGRHGGRRRVTKRILLPDPILHAPSGTSPGLCSTYCTRIGASHCGADPTSAVAPGAGTAKVPAVRRHPTPPCRASCPLPCRLRQHGTKTSRFPSCLRPLSPIRTISYLRIYHKSCPRPASHAVRPVRATCAVTRALRTRGRMPWPRRRSWDS